MQRRAKRSYAIALEEESGLRHSSEIHIAATSSRDLLENLKGRDS